MSEAGTSELFDQATISGRLREIAAYLWLEREPFRARAYQRAATALDAARDFPRLLREGRLVELPGIGPSLAGAIGELAASGTTGLLDRLRQRWPPVLVELQRLPGLGERRARRLHEALAIATLEELAEACRAGRVRTLPGFGARSEARLLAAIGELRQPQPARALLLPEARELAETLAQHLAAAPGTVAAGAAGQVRRGVEVVDRVILAVATSSPTAARQHLARHPLVLGVDAHDEGATSVSTATGADVELCCAPAARFGVALARATGSPEHWDKLRARAADRGLDLDELEAEDEHALYAALDLPWLPPEIRDGDDEIDAAADGRLPGPLVTLADVRGAIHCHTLYSDGKGTILDMAQAAARRGLEYLTITDHSQSARYAGGLTPDDLRRQWDEIDEVQTRVPIRLFKGTEADILADGALDWPDDILDRLEVVIASVHQRHGMDEDAMTRRLVRAMRWPRFKIWGHALGRLLLRRPPFSCRMEEVLDAIAASPAAIELNGDPHRLDLEPRWARRASARGIRFVLSTDAHSTRALGCVEYAVTMARRARLTPADVLNTLPAHEFARAVRPVQ